MSTENNKISKEWTSYERMALVFMLSDQIRDDILSDSYGDFGQPNIQSIHEMLAADRDELESNRKEFQNIVDGYAERSIRLDDLVSRYKAVC